MDLDKFESVILKGSVIRQRVRPKPQHEPHNTVKVLVRGVYWVELLPTAVHNHASALRRMPETPVVACASLRALYLPVRSLLVILIALITGRELVRPGSRPISTQSSLMRSLFIQ